MVRRVSSREHLHKVIEELSEQESVLVLKLFDEQRRHEAPGPALGKALLGMYRARASEAANN